jgi:hypothetical protein
MKNLVRRQIKTVTLAVLLAAAFGSGKASAQSGSAGGSIGNDEKSLSGSRDTPRAVESSKPSRRSKPEAEEPRRAARKTGGGSGGGSGNFDGVWVVNAVGCGGTSTSTVVVSSGKIIGEGVTGTISPNGVSHSVGNYNGIIVTSTGRASGRSGYGTFNRSDGCSGTLTSTKQ